MPLTGVGFPGYPDVCLASDAPLASSVLDTNNNSIARSFAQFVPALAKGFDPKDYEEVKCITKAQHGHVFLWQHKVQPGQKIVVKRTSNNAKQTTTTKRHGKRFHSWQRGEDPFTEFGASLFMSGLSGLSEETPEGPQGSCPFLPHIYGCWRDEHHTYLASEYCVGGELFKLAEETGGVAEEKVRVFIRDTLCAVKYLHDNGVAHRDISLENILLGADGRVRLIDLGAAHELCNCGVDVPAKGMFGKDMYRAPEMYPTGKLAQKVYAADKVDIWEVGQCAFILLVGKPLWLHPNEIFEPRGAFDFAYKSGLAKLFQHWKVPLSKDAESFIEAMLHMDPERRPSADEALTLPWLQNLEDS